MSDIDSSLGSLRGKKEEDGALSRVAAKQVCEILYPVSIMLRWGFAKLFITH